MKVLQVHNRYLDHGGEDVVVEREAELLESAGIRVVTLTVSNADAKDWPAWRLAGSAVWNRKSYDMVATAIRTEQPDVVHAHNLHHVLSPGILWAARRQGAAVVHTVHNFRLACVNALLLRGGRPCEDCVGRATAWRGVVRDCYPQGRAAAAVVAAVSAVHGWGGTWRKAVDRFVAPTVFGRDIMVRAGLPADRIAVKPNFVPDPGAPVAPKREGALFVGRIAEEKGLSTLVESWRESDRPLNVVGSGPLLESLSPTAPGAIRWLGRLDAVAIQSLMADSEFLVVPSLWYETFGLVIAEAFSCGLPVIASRLGAMAELVEDGQTGLLFNPGDALDLRSKCDWAFAHPHDMRRMGERARRMYLERYAPAANLAILAGIYADACAHQRVEG